ncbi:hypothetical protein J416_14031 [Gracilibacillus halophilus YIM-C55.5]|uniref:Uncharacterized protein n=1 Tax=Gracilibacillus halophilus YIM-C55.5 TaxID=1308866 RepID=N4WI34_9BACI|nr:hypothetical protein [Gracilibacillus halophilus]ENH95837.1 hypothetical protein J416_14031 [Gracilibacillus halophilus YIM-C55.5]
MSWLSGFSSFVVLVFIIHPWFDLKTFQKIVGITLFLEIFYVIGHYLMEWPFPTPVVLLQLFVTSGLGVMLGVCFSRLWPLPHEKGFERILRTFFIVIPSLGFGMALQVTLQGAEATQAIYLIFACAAWLGSGRFVRQTDERKDGIATTEEIEFSR